MNITFVFWLCVLTLCASIGLTIRNVGTGQTHLLPINFIGMVGAGWGIVLFLRARKRGIIL